MMLSYWIIISICALGSFFFSMADMVYSLADVDKLSRVEGKNKKQAEIAIKLANDYEMSVSSILFGNNIVNIFMSSIVTIIGMRLNSNNPGGSFLVCNLASGKTNPTWPFFKHCDIVFKKLKSKFFLSASFPNRKSPWRKIGL